MCKQEFSVLIHDESLTRIRQAHMKQKQPSYELFLFTLCMFVSF